MREIPEKEPLESKITFLENFPHYVPPKYLNTRVAFELDKPSCEFMSR